MVYWSPGEIVLFYTYVECCITIPVHACREVGPCTMVWSEKEMVDKATYEFAEVVEL